MIVTVGVVFFPSYTKGAVCVKTLPAYEDFTISEWSSKADLGQLFGGTRIALKFYPEKTTLLHLGISS